MRLNRLLPILVVALAALALTGCNSEATTNEAPAATAGTNATAPAANGAENATPGTP